MLSFVRGGRSRAALALGLGLGVLSGSAEAGGILPMRKKDETKVVAQVHEPGVGTLGYGPPGLHPGFQGFGLGFHPGYGYGGDALGPGADGGYPFYGGPGYPHPAPTLWRCGGINPFVHNAGPGGPTPTCPNYYGGVGPLAEDPPVLTILPEPGEGGYGGFSGARPYPESYFAPYTTEAAARGAAAGVSSVRQELPPHPSTSAPTLPLPDSMPPN
jgi:hypothetical protein